jgi:hypothetical protein
LLPPLITHMMTQHLQLRVAVFVFLLNPRHTQRPCHKPVLPPPIYNIHSSLPWSAQTLVCGGGDNVSILKW